MTTTPLTGPEEQHRPVTALHQNSSGQGEDLSPRSPRHARGVPAPKESTAIGSGSADTVVLRFNEDNMANEELYERAGHARDVARSARLNAERHLVLAKKARDAGIGLTEVQTAFRVADERARDAETEQHRR